MPSAAVTITVGTTQVDVTVTALGATGLVAGAATNDVTWNVGHGPVVTTPNGLNRYRLGVDNAGALTLTHL